VQSGESKEAKGMRKHPEASDASNSFGFRSSQKHALALEMSDGIEGSSVGRIVGATCLRFRLTLSCV
jgi:hypothetical protein